MSEPGVTTDQSHIRPSRRANIPPRTLPEVLREKPHCARLKRFLSEWREAPAAEKTLDYTVLEGNPTDRADVDLPIDLPERP